MLNILCLSGDCYFFQISPGTKSLYDVSRKLIHFLAVETKFGTSEVISANLLTGETTRVHIFGALVQSVYIVRL